MARKHGVIVMDDTMMRQLIAAEVANQPYGSEEFIRQLTSGEQDDGPYMTGARVVRDWFASQMAPAPEVIDE